MGWGKRWNAGECAVSNDQKKYLGRVPNLKKKPGVFFGDVDHFVSEEPCSSSWGRAGGKPRDPVDHLLAKTMHQRETRQREFL